VILAYSPSASSLRISGRRTGKFHSGAQGLARPLLAIFITAGYVVVFDDIGAITSVVVLVTGWLLLVERKSVLVSASTGVLTGLVVYLVFERFLQTRFRGDCCSNFTWRDRC